MLKHFLGVHFAFTIFLMVLIFVPLGFSQQNIAQQASAIFEQSCLNCHGEHGAFTEEIIIDHTALIETGAVVPKRPGASELYQRLIEKRVERRMPLGQPPLSPAAINTIRQWILAGAPDWADTTESDSPFITPKELLERIEKHVNSLASFDRTYTRYFTLTHLYNAGETSEALHAYRRALSKLVNSLSWGRVVKPPEPIDREETIFYIDLRDYEWEIGTNRWTQIEQVYPYSIEFNAPTQTNLREKLLRLREAMDCEVPFVDVDWFLATASLPPLYHDILGLPQTDRALEARLEVNVVENIRNAAGKRVWRAGFNDSGVSNNNRVVERHVSRYGAYWKSYDFAGSAGKKNIFTNPLSFEHDGGEIVFNLPNGLQAYYLVDAGGNRLDAAPISIVRNLAASDPTVRNGLSCIGCHTEGMKTFKDQVRGVVKKNPKPPFNKDRALRLYTAKATMDAFIAEDTDRYRQALEAAGGIFGGIEPIQRFYEAFQRPLNATRAAAAVGLETQAFLRKIRQNVGLTNLGLGVLESGTVKRDAWTSRFGDVIFALDFPEKSESTPTDPQEERIPGASVYIPDSNLRDAIAEALGKGRDATITVEEMATLTRLDAVDAGVEDLTGLQQATNMERLDLNGNQISDISPLAGLVNLSRLELRRNQISDISPLAGLVNIVSLNIRINPLSDISPLANLVKMDFLEVSDTKVSDLSPLAGLNNLREFKSWNSPISDLSPLAHLTVIDMCGAPISDLSALAGAKNLRELYLVGNEISDVSPLAGLSGLNRLNLEGNNILDVSPLAGLTHLKWLGLQRNAISDFSPLDRLAETTAISRTFNPGSPTGGPKIEGPWLWVTVPGEHLDESRDLLAEASGGTLTEQQVAVNGVSEGTRVGSSVWTAGKIAPKGGANITEMLSSIGMGNYRNIGNRVVYGSVTLDSPREQDTMMLVGSDDGIKVWLNGELVHQALFWHRATDYQYFFPVTLKRGANVLLVAVDGRGWGSNNGFFGFEMGTEYTLSSPGIGYTFSEASIHSGDTFTLDIEAENIYDLAGWQFDIAFDPAVLEAIGVSEGNFLKSGGGTTFFRRGVIDNTTGKITKLSAAQLSGNGVSGSGSLLSVTLRAKTDGQTQLKLENFQLAASTGASIDAGPHEAVITVEEQLTTGDVNRDGQVSILDMVLVARHFGETASAHSEVDVNGDGIINILDLILVAQHMGASTPAAPSMLAIDNIEELDPAVIQAWITQAQVENDGSIAFQQGIAKLQMLLVSLIPEETVLLANYPNPFNPETWIPYQLVSPSEIIITIYDARGIVVRQLELGPQREGYYTSRNRAAYWDGRNGVGERVASGIYFYQLQADNVSLLRKMVILK